MKKQLALVLGASFLLGGCALVNNLTKKTQETAIEQAVRAECKLDADTCDFLATQAKSFQRPLVMTGTYKSDDKAMAGLVTETRMDGQGNMQAISNENGKEVSNMIIFNNATYMKDYADNQWFKMSDGEESDQSLFNAKELLDDIQENFSEENVKLVVKKLGEETCENLTCVKYEVTETELINQKTYVWVDTKEKLTRKMEIASDEGTTIMTYEYEDVVIGEPAPVKEFMMPELPEGAADQMPSLDDIEQMMKDLPEIPTEE